MSRTKLFVGGLPQACDDAALREHFSQYGEVEDATVYMDNSTGRSRGFGYVTFESDGTAEAALEGGERQEILGKSAEVKLSLPREDVPASRGAQTSRRGRQNSPPPKRARRDASGPYTFKILCSENVVASLIGKGGSTLARIQEETGASFDFSQRGAYFPGTRCRTLTVRAGDPEAVAAGIDVVVDHVSEVAVSQDDEVCKGRNPGDCRVVTVVTRFTAGALIGKGAENIKRLRAEVRCFIDVQTESKKDDPIIEGHQRVEARGEAEEVKRAMRRVNARVQDEADRDWFPAWAAEFPSGGRVPEEPRSRRPPTQPHGTNPEDLEAFRERYPMDEQAWEYLVTSAPSVQAKVVTEFKPPREGDGNYSALITSFVKTCYLATDSRSRGSGPGLAAPGVPAIIASRAASPPDLFRGHASGRAAPPVPERRVERKGVARRPGCAEAVSELAEVASAVPREYLEFDYCVTCHLPEDQSRPLDSWLRANGQLWAERGVKISFSPSGNLERQLSITGPLPTIYTVHLLMMRAFNDGEAPPVPVGVLQVEKMQQQIAALQAQLASVRGR
mmetsp:Transcript_71166/g.154676  ORF Transcript_71166/g.154676 Transcript_71166/m.154676 type:complete len:561 (+) Transcript_71166:69-1751(+)